MIEAKFPDVHLLDTEPRSEDPELSFHSDFPQVKIPFQATIAGVQMDGISLSQTTSLWPRSDGSASGRENKPWTRIRLKQDHTVTKF